MKSLFSRASWLLLPLIVTTWSASAPATDLRIIVLIGVWTVGILYLLPALAAPVRWLRRHPTLLWIVWLLAFCAVIITWLLRFDPAVGIPLSITEQLWLVGNGVVLVCLPLAGYQRTEKIPALKWRAGILVTLTTILLIAIGIELSLRYLWVMSDNFQFSKLHQNWHRLYWNPINDAGYRDYAVPSTNNDRTHILVLGDSLVTGYGVNSIDDTFPQLLDSQLGDAYTVNIVAQPGWGVASALGAAQAYPITPDVVILSHYINDINEGTAAQVYDRPFPQIRVEPTEAQRWWTDRFYVANFLYYRVFLYTQHDAVGLYNDWIYDAYDDERVWQAYETELQSVIDWTNEIDAQLVVLVWSDLTDVEGSQIITTPVTDFFTAQNIPVVDMAPDLQILTLAERTVNLFDAHPSIQSHQLAAQRLTDTIETPE